MNPPERTAIEEAQDERDEDNRRSALTAVLRNIVGRPAADAELVLLSNALGLDEELDELAASSPKRHRRITDVRLQLAELAEHTELTRGAPR